MKLSGPKLIDRIDLWVAKFDPAGVRIPPNTDEQRFVEIEPSSAGMASIWANIHAPDAAALDQRLDALGASVCQRSAHHDAAPRRRWGRWAAARPLACGCGSPDCPVARRTRRWGQWLFMLAERPPSTGASAGVSAGFGILATESVRGWPPRRGANR